MPFRKTFSMRELPRTGKEHMRLIQIRLAKIFRKLAAWHVDRADIWQRRAGTLDARAMAAASDNIAKLEPYDRTKHGEPR